MKKFLEDQFYEEQVQRLSGLSKFPAVPAAQQELRRTLRHISETDRTFIERLISDVVDTSEKCPTPAELRRRAMEKRQLSADAHKPLGNPDCQVCNGSGWVSYQKRVEPGSVDPYDADFSRPCKCRT